MIRDQNFILLEGLPLKNPVRCLVLISLGIMCACTNSSIGNQNCLINWKTSSKAIDFVFDDPKTMANNEKPYIGMAIDEVGKAMHLQDALVTLNGKILYGIYQGSNYTRFHVYFSGSMPAVFYWSVFEHDEIRLLDVEELYPETNFLIY